MKGSNMKTFEFIVKNLGPIKSASFSSSHLNILCGKNNSGKSFLIHAVYCIFQYLNDTIKIKPQKELIDELLAKGAATFPLEDYFGDINGLISKAMDKVLVHLPGLMNKSKEAFEGCEISVSIDERYAREFLSDIPVDIRLRPLQNLRVLLVKDRGKNTCRFILENGEETMPNGNIIGSTLRFALRQLMAKVLPMPILLTAERTGVSVFANDVMSYALSKRSEQTQYGIDRAATAALLEHYPMAIIQEMILQSDIRQTREDRPYLMGDIPQAQEFYEWFRSNVMDGDVVARNGKLYFKQFSNRLDMPFVDVSSSVRALTELNYFVHYLMAPGALLMIDEPELNLHPERQRLLMRALARMSNNFGVGIVLSTHSVTMIRELNTLLAFKALGENAANMAKNHGYEDAELLDENNVSCGVVENGTIYQSTQGLQKKGFFVQSFDDTNDAIASVQSDIVSQWE